MSYTGTITILDVRGNVRQVLHERELTPDEIIRELLEDKKLEKELDATLNGIEEPRKKRKYTKRVSKDTFTGNALKPKKREGKECCGSTGSRHFKWCAEAGGTGNPAFVRKPSGRIPFSEKTYDTVKGLFGSGLTTDAVSAEKGLDMNELAKIRKSSSYNEYFKKV